MLRYAAPSLLRAEVWSVQTPSREGRIFLYVVEADLATLLLGEKLRAVKRPLNAGYAATLDTRDVEDCI